LPIDVLLLHISREKFYDMWLIFRRFNVAAIFRQRPAVVQHMNIWQRCSLHQTTADVTLFVQCYVTMLAIRLGWHGTAKLLQLILNETGLRKVRSELQFKSFFQQTYLFIWNMKLRTWFGPRMKDHLGPKQWWRFIKIVILHQCSRSHTQ
jgi:hypothetical protein